MKKQYFYLSFILLSAMNAFAQPANDDCSTAIVMACGDSQTGETTTATIDVAPLCGASLDITAPGVWYTFVGTGDAITASLCDVATTFDTKIIVYSGTCGTLICEAGNDDAGGSCGLQSVTTFNSVLGTDYFILVTGYGASIGDFSLTLTCTAPCLPLVSNDDCATAQMITLAADPASCMPTTGTTECASISLVNTTCNTFGITKDVWYEFNSGTNGSVEIDLDTLTSLNNLNYAIYDVCGGLQFGVPGCGTLMHATNTILTGLAPGTFYYLQLFNTSALGTGTFTLCIMDEQPAPPGPINDECNASILLTEELTCTVTPGTVLGATQSLPPNMCNTFTSPAANDVWYSFVATYPITTVVVDPMFDPVVELMDDCTGTTILGCSDNVGVLTEVITVTSLTVGNTYYIRVLPYGTSAVDPNFGICVHEGYYTSISEIAAPQFRIFPNPTNGILNLQYENITEGSILVVNNVGQIAKKLSLTNTINLSDLEKGIYHISLLDVDGSVIAKDRVVVN